MLASKYIYINQIKKAMNTKKNHSKKNLNEIMSGVNGIEILDIKIMSHVRGGDGEAGFEPIIILPPKKP
jgi:hypothetical protein